MCSSAPEMPTSETDISHNNYQPYYKLRQFHRLHQKLILELSHGDLYRDKIIKNGTTNTLSVS